MQKREKILLGILIIITIGFLGQKAFSSLNSSGKSEESLVEYSLENLGQKIKPRKNVGLYRLLPGLSNRNFLETANGNLRQIFKRPLRQTAIYGKIP